MRIACQTDGFNMPFSHLLLLFCLLICRVHFNLLIAGTDIILWHGKSGKVLGNVDTNQLKNHMAAVSPNGRFIAAAAFTADVKVNSSFWTSKTHFKYNDYISQVIFFL